MIFHISGSPGSGKTTLGKKLEDVACVYDTDDLLTDAETRDIVKTGLINGHKAAHALWKKTFHDRIARAVETAEKPHVVFVGILNHYSPHGKMIQFPKDAQKYFIDIPDDRLMRQFYGRYNSTDDDEFWKGVASGRYQIPGSVYCLRESEKERKWHLERGYKLCSVDAIEKEIRGIISH
jgi:adenylate kinase family enzyme